MEIHINYVIFPVIGEFLADYIFDAVFTASEVANGALVSGLESEFKGTPCVRVLATSSTATEISFTVEPFFVIGGSLETITQFEFKAEQHTTVYAGSNVSFYLDCSFEAEIGRWRKNYEVMDLTWEQVFADPEMNTNIGFLRVTE